jgi:hypothetical protein
MRREALSLTPRTWEGRDWGLGLYWTQLQTAIVFYRDASMKCPYKFWKKVFYPTQNFSLAKRGVLLKQNRGRFPWAMDFLF